MDIDGLPIVGASIDLTKVPSIHSKRTLAFLNHFICQTANFLNKFACVCETKLEDINMRIQRIETSLSILEAKLSSVPGLDDIQLPTAGDAPGPASGAAVPGRLSVENSSPMTSRVDTSGNETISPRNQSDNRTEATEVSKSETTTNSTLNLTVCQDPRYAKYFKSLKVGVPAMGVRQKMVADGVNPDLLDNPNAPAPPEDPDKEVSERSDSDSEIGSDFSD